MAAPRLVPSNSIDTLELALNPEPLTVIWSPTFPEVLLRVITACCVLKVTAGDEPMSSLPVIACDPLAVAGIVIDKLVKLPLLLVMTFPILLVSKTIEIIELALKPVPLTSIWLPGRADAGFSVITGVIVKL